MIVGITLFSPLSSPPQDMGASPPGYEDILQSFQIVTPNTKELVYHRGYHIILKHTSFLVLAFGQDKDQILVVRVCMHTMTTIVFFLVIPEYCNTCSYCQAHKRISINSDSINIKIERDGINNTKDKR